MTWCYANTQKHNYSNINEKRRLPLYAFEEKKNRMRKGNRERETETESEISFDGNNHSTTGKFVYFQFYRLIFDVF